uniref:Uncharacterized protein n=1 Tax=Oryza brachyantha TaxID=4533 RepID=J3NF66_ORYBR
MILGHGGLELRARAHIVLAKCYLSDPKFSVYEDPSAVLDPLNQAAEDLEVLEEDAAASFKQHRLALDNPYKEEDRFTDMLTLSSEMAS